MDDTLLEERNGPVLRLTLNRPRQRNALSLSLLERLQKAIEAAQSDAAARFVVITGAPPAFCAGHDLSEMSLHFDADDRGKGFNETLFNACSRLMLLIRQSRLLFIAEVNGVATAAGCQLVATCDMAVASDEAQFGVNGINVGLFCSTPMVALSRTIPPKLALELLTTGRLMTAREALEAGLVNRLEKPEDLSRAVEVLVEALIKQPANVLALGKRAFYRQLELSEPDAYRFTTGVIVDNLAMSEARTGISSFVKRKTRAD